MTVQALPTPTAAPAVSEASERLAQAHEVALDRVHRDELGQLLATLATLESQTEALRLKVLAEAERRQVAADEAATGTDAWAAALTGTTREVNAGGLHLAELLKTTYHHTREAYAAGQLRTDQVRVIVRAAEQAPTETTPEQLAAAEEVLVGKATGVGTRSGRPMNAKRLRQAARRMLDIVDHDLADRHEAIMLGRESRRAKHETYLALHDNGDGTYSGRFTIPELHGSLLRTAIETLSAPRRLNRARTSPEGESISGYDESAPTGPDHGLSGWEIHGHALCELIEHLPTTGWSGANALTVLVTMSADDLTRDLTATGHTDPAHLAGLARPRRDRHRHPRHRHPHRRRRPAPPGLRGRPRPRRPRHQTRHQRLRAPRPRPHPTAPHPPPTTSPVHRLRLVRDRDLRTPLRLDRDPPPHPLGPRRRHRHRRRHPPVLLAPPPSPRPHLAPRRPPPARLGAAQTRPAPELVRRAGRGLSGAPPAARRAPCLDRRRVARRGSRGARR